MQRSMIQRGAGPAAVLGIAALAAFSTLEPTPATPRPGSPYRVVIDPGHGGTDPGAVANGLTEKVLNLEVALRLRDLLDLDTADPLGGGEWDVRLTRTTDVTVSLADRVTLANTWPADRFVSIHHNAFSSSAANGTETFSYAAGTISADLRDRVQEELLLGLGLADRGSKTANFYVLRETTMPASLSEGGFLTSPIDASVLASPATWQASAEAHLFALQRHFGLAPYLPQANAPLVYCSPKTSSAGCTPAIGFTGTPSFAASDFVVYCDQVLTQQFGLLLWSDQPANIPFFGGTLCLGNAPQRTQVAFSNGLPNVACSGRLELPITSGFLVNRGLFPGSTVYTQWWYRDPGLLPAAPVGLSEGLRFTVLP
ncbi:MAG: N-acetylmuramoyl-L-alanine amidase [Planctomycetota bacterium]